MKISTSTKFTKQHEHMSFIMIDFTTFACHTEWCLASEMCNVMFLAKVRYAVRNGCLKRQVVSYIVRQANSCGLKMGSLNRMRGSAVDALGAKCCRINGLVAHIVHTFILHISGSFTGHYLLQLSSR